MLFNQKSREELEALRDEMYDDLMNMGRVISDIRIRQEKVRKELRDVEDKLGYIPGVGMTDVDLESVKVVNLGTSLNDSLNDPAYKPDNLRMMVAGKPVDERWHGVEGVELHKAIGVYLAGVYTKKNSDYGDAFGKSLDKHGMKAAVVRMEDKLGRLDALTSGTEQQVFDEKLEDTVLDLANYAIMTAMYMIEKGRE